MIRWALLGCFGWGVVVRVERVGGRGGTRAGRRVAAGAGLHKGSPRPGSGMASTRANGENTMLAPAIRASHSAGGFTPPDLARPSYPRRPYNSGLNTSPNRRRSLAALAIGLQRHDEIWPIRGHQSGTFHGVD